MRFTRPWPPENMNNRPGYIILESATFSTQETQGKISLPVLVFNVAEKSKVSRIIFSLGSSLFSCCWWFVLFCFVFLLVCLWQQHGILSSFIFRNSVSWYDLCIWIVYNIWKVSLILDHSSFLESFLKFYLFTASVTLDVDCTLKSAGAVLCSLSSISILFSLSSLCNKEAFKKIL